MSESGRSLVLILGSVNGSIAYESDKSVKVQLVVL